MIEAERIISVDQERRIVTGVYRNRNRRVSWGPIGVRHLKKETLAKGHKRNSMFQLKPKHKLRLTALIGWWAASIISQRIGF